MRDIGKNIRQLRIQKNMTQDDLAEKLFVTRQTVSNYETGRSRPDVETLANIADILESDINSIIYGATAVHDKKPAIDLLAGCLAVILLLLFRKLAAPYINVFTSRHFVLGLVMLVYCLLDPLIWLLSGWTITRLFITTVKKGPLKYRWIPCIRRTLSVLLIVWLVISIAYLLPNALDDFLYSTQRRGVWVEEPYESDGEILMGKSWQRIPLPFVEWAEALGAPIARFSFDYAWTLGLWGIGLCLCGFPCRKQENHV